MAASHNTATGRHGEQLVAEWYQQGDWEVIERNWRCRHGEVDLIVRRHDVLVFCEVKTRTSQRFGSGAEAVTWRKQQTLRSLAAAYLAQRESGAFLEVRFDVAVVTPCPGRWLVEVIAAAF